MKIKSKIIYVFDILLVFGISCIISIFYKNYATQNVVKEFNYYSNDSSSFEVYYSGSDIVSGKSTEDGFIRKYTDRVDINFDYILNFSDVVSGSEEVLVKANVIVNAPNSETEIWKSNTEYLQPSKKIEYEASSLYSFTKKVSVDYQKYYAMYEKVKNETSIVSNAKIRVEFISSSVFKTDGIKKLTKTDNIIYDIPLSDVAYSINKKTNINNNIKQEKIIKNNANEKKGYIYLIIACIVLIIITLVSMINRYLNDKSKNGKYYNELNKILKSYDSIIVNTEKLPDIEGKEIINVVTFEELIDAQMELRLPISYCEVIKGYESEFMIITNDVIWLYKLKRERRNKK